MNGTIEIPYEQDQSDAKRYGVDFVEECARYRKPDTDYALNAIVRPAKSTGLQYKATTAGHSGVQEPRWPTAVAGTVNDGSVVWTAEAFGAGSLERTLSSAVWTVDSGLTKASQLEDGTQSTAILSGGTEGQVYLVRVLGTLSDGQTINGHFYLKIRRPPGA